MPKLAMTQNFVRVVTDEIDNEKYLGYKDGYDDKVTTDITEKFDITIFKGYHWYTLACRTQKIYDLYRVFNKSWNLILETEDEIVELPSWYVPEDEITVWAYEKDGDTLILKAINNDYRVRLPDRQEVREYWLSVVIPLYNSELFMCRTIDSILSSSLENIELILLDDWSSDKSYEIAQWYANNYGCVKAYHWDNHGVSFTRNHWLDLAKWEFIAFCDNDDIVHPLMYETLYLTCKTQWVDIAICPALIRSDIDNKELYLTCSAKPENTVIYSFEDMVQYRGTKANIFWVAVWNKIVKTEVAKLAKFPTDYAWPWILYEDVAYTSSLYSYIDKFAHCKNAFYTWDKRKQKTVGTASTRHQKEDNEYVWKMFIYWFTYALYNKSGKHLEAHDYTHFKRLIESYDKFNTPSDLRTYWDMKLTELITNQKLNENKLIMADDHLREVINNLWLEKYWFYNEY